MEADYLSWGQLCGIFILAQPKWLFISGVYQRWSCWHPVPLNASIITPWKCHYLWGPLGLNAIVHLWKFQISYVFPPPALVPLVLSMFLTEHVKGQLRLLILVEPCWTEAPWIPTVLNMLADIPQHCPFIKDLIMDVLVGHMLSGLPYLHLILWLLSNVCCTNRGSLPQSVGQLWGNLSIYNKGLPAVLEGISSLVC